MDGSLPEFSEGFHQPSLAALIHAQGVVLAALEALLIGKGILKPGILSETLVYMSEPDGDVTGATDPETSEILSGWAAMLAPRGGIKRQGEGH